MMGGGSDFGHIRSNLAGNGLPSDLNSSHAAMETSLASISLLADQKQESSTHRRRSFLLNVDCWGLASCLLLLLPACRGSFSMSTGAIGLTVEVW